jgi:uncharacterized membrane protein YjgN (DUF898 family)
MAEHSDSMVPQRELALRFSGSGAEYFRIWIINLLLTVLTLGVYSAWAKTRRLQYFYRNTQLAGASFDFCGKPKAILRGRIVTVALLLAYHYAFGFSATTGLVIVSLLLASLPFMMRSALRFRLSNTVYRGLPFGFAGGSGKAYLVYPLPVITFLVVSAMDALEPGAVLIGAFILLCLCWPLMHGAMRGYQHRHLMYGDRRADFALPAASLARPYMKAALLGLAVMAVLAGLILLEVRHKDAVGQGFPISMTTVATTVSYLYVLLAGAWIMVCMNNLAWSATRFPGVRIECRMNPGAWLRLQAVNALLTLLTLGLYRPYAAVRAWRYRVEHVRVRVEAPDGFERVTQLASRRPVGATGDGLADILDVDLSW